MRRAISNLVALIITTIILVVASSIVLIKSGTIVSALKPSVNLSAEAKCKRILNSSTYICIITANMHYCGKIYIITEQGVITLEKCLDPRSPFVIALNAKPIAMRIESYVKAVEVR